MEPRRSYLPLRQTYRRALMAGWTIEQAGRLAAWRDGLAPSQDWTMRQVQHVEFIRWLHETGRIAGDTGAIA